MKIDFLFKFFFHLLLCQVQWIRSFLVYPCVHLIYFLFPSSWVAKRLHFERKNLRDPSSHPLGREKRHSDFCFEISSEGELEQIYPLLLKWLEEDLTIELLYSSPSAEKNIESLIARYPKTLRTLRMPLLSYHFFNTRFSVALWVTAKNIILCRYDFYPELLLLSKGRSLILLSAKLKEKGLHSIFHKQLYSLFSLIVATSRKQEKYFTRLLSNSQNICFYEFRTKRIETRLLNAQKTLKTKDYFEKLSEAITLYPRNRRLIGGSIWPIDLKILSSTTMISDIKERKLCFLIVPHKLENSFVEDLVDQIELSLPVHLLKEGQETPDLLKEPGVLIVQDRGILLELYTLFQYAFVGGGHGRSIHSVLEPYHAHCRIFCGRSVKRSSEYDLISQESPQSIKKIEDLRTLYKELANWNKIKKSRVYSKQNDTTFETIAKRLEKFLDVK